MRRALAIALLQFRLEFRNRASAITWFALPLLFTLVFGGLLGGGWSAIPVAVVDNDQSLASRQIVKDLRADRSLSVVATDAPKLRKLFLDKRVGGALIIPKGFERAIRKGLSPSARFVAGPSGNIDAAMKPAISRSLYKVASDYRAAVALEGQQSIATRLALVAKQRAAAPVVVSRSYARKPEAAAGSASPVSQTALGFITMSMMWLAFSMGGVVLREREHGTWGRLLVTPAKRRELVGGYILSFQVTGLFQFAVLIGASSLLFGIVWGPILPLMFIAGAFLLCASGMGFLLASLVRTSDQQGAIGAVVVMGSSLLGGAFWPLDIVSPFMQKIAHFTPQAWAMDAFRESVLRGGALSTIATPIGVLLGFAACFMTAAVLRVRYD